MALIETAIANQRAGNHIISTAIEHASVYNRLAIPGRAGLEVTLSAGGSYGHICLEDLENGLSRGYHPVSVMYVNNEVGAVEPMEEIASLIQRKNPAILLPRRCHSGVRKVRHPAETAGIRPVTVSGHKIHAPKGRGLPVH